MLKDVTLIAVPTFFGLGGAFMFFAAPFILPTRQDVFCVGVFGVASP
jgi:hypothetical protein